MQLALLVGLTVLVVLGLLAAAGYVIDKDAARRERSRQGPAMTTRALTKSRRDSEM